MAQAATRLRRARQARIRRADARKLPCSPLAMVRAASRQPENSRVDEADATTGSITSAIERRQQNATTSEGSTKPKKPPMSRRATSSKWPQKGQ